MEGISGIALGNLGLHNYLRIGGLLGDCLWFEPSGTKFSLYHSWNNNYQFGVTNFHEEI
jgi:hypothetical protein